MHVSMGSLGRGSSPEPSQPAGFRRRGQRPNPRRSRRWRHPWRAPRAWRRPAPMRPVFVTPATHLVGLGARVGGSTAGFGATARAWAAIDLARSSTVSR